MTRVTERFFRTINYSSVNEDWRTEIAALKLREGGRVLCVTGSGDRPLDLLAVVPTRLVAIDRNPAQNYLLKLKMAALKHLTFEDYAAFLGLNGAEPGWRRRVFDRLTPSLEGDTLAFWKCHGRDIGSGVLYQGRFERHFKRIAMLAHCLRPRAIDELFGFTDLERQCQFIKERWDTPYWRFAYRLILCPLTSRILLRDPAYYAHVAVPVGDTLFERMQRALQRSLARDNFMINLTLRGKLSPTDLPPYLTPEGCARIRERLHLIEVVDADVVDYLMSAAAETFTHFSLSDVSSYMAETDFHRLLTAVARSAVPGARVVIRQFLTRYDPLDPQKTRIDREPHLEAQLADQDRSIGYEFLVGVVREPNVGERRPSPGGRSSDQADPRSPNARSELVIADYEPDDNAAALELDRKCLQGEAYRLSFRRSTFDRRARNYRDWRILVARLSDQVVGTLGMALKDVTLDGKSTSAGFLFDLRVHPEYRRKGIAQRLAAKALDWAFARAPVVYIYVVADNRITQHIASLLGGSDAGTYAYLVYPTYRTGRARTEAHTATFNEIHEAYLAHSTPFQLYSNPQCRPGRGGYVGSWIIGGGTAEAGCSAWSNRGILAEVVERIPVPIRLARRTISAWPLRKRPWPHLPEKGEELRSWYIFDFFATSTMAARELMRSVETEAVANEIDYCYVIHQPQDAWVNALRSDSPRFLSPTITYRRLARMADGSPVRLKRVYVDIRDL
ncbi:MAG: GNAT family N-acetyltransferase [Gemmatimonadota bacterium]|nr:MAG: GNAT family N-acetyltransferase [Gemmatimonadota bacterium]